MSDEVKIIAVGPSNVDQYGFFCYKSKAKSVGYGRKLSWLKERFREGLKIKLLYEDEASLRKGRPAGFIEYIPGEFAWRAVRASGYLLIHCLWVIGRWKQKGYGSRLLSECVADARSMNKLGVAMVTSEGVWLAGKELLAKNGFQSVDQAPPCFNLMAIRLKDTRPPAFPRDWPDRLGRCGSGMTIYHTDQCPYLEDAVKAAQAAAAQRDLKTRAIKLATSQEVQDLSPSPYGVFNIVCNDTLLTYHYIHKKEMQLLDRLLEKPGGR